MVGQWTGRQSDIFSVRANSKRLLATYISLHDLVIFPCFSKRLSIRKYLRYPLPLVLTRLDSPTLPQCRSHRLQHLLSRVPKDLISPSFRFPLFAEILAASHRPTHRTMSLPIDTRGSPDIFTGRVSLSPSSLWSLVLSLLLAPEAP